MNSPFLVSKVFFPERLRGFYGGFIGTRTYVVYTFVCACACVAFWENPF